MKTRAELAIGAGVGTLIYQVVRFGVSGIDMFSIVLVVVVTHLICTLTQRTIKKNE